MSLTRHRENVCCTWLYHQSARLIKSDSLFAVVVTEAAWSGEIIFLHALLTLFLFSSFKCPPFLFVSVFLFSNCLILPSPSLPFHCCHSNSSWRLYTSCSSSFDLPTFLSPLPTTLRTPTPVGTTIQRPSKSVYSCVAYRTLDTLFK